jgi:hypothetical protein
VLILAAIGLTELGFFYATVFAYVLMTIAFMEMMRVKVRDDKEKLI